MSAGVYIIRNVLNGKVYVGSSAKLKRRLYEHRRALRAGTHQNKHLLASWTKYGETAFLFNILLEMDDITEMLRQEKRLILEYSAHLPSCGFNISIEPSNSQLGLKRSAEICAKIGAAKRGNKNRLGQSLSADARERIAAKLRGTKASDATRAKLSAMRKGRPHSVEWSARIGAAHKGKVIPAEMRERIRAALTGRKLSQETLAKRSATVAAKKAARAAQPGVMP